MKTKIISLILALVTVLGTVAIPSFASEQFTDVPKGEWYYDAVYACVEKKLFTGTSDTTFSPNLGMTRAMFVTVLASQASFNKADYKTSSFKDVKAGMWYSENVEWAYKNGLVSGTGNGNFSPDKTVTRQELVAMLYKYGAYLGLDMTKGENLDITSYPDYDTVDSWAIPGFKWAIKNGLVSGIKSGEDTLLAPKATSTRAMVALIMVNLFKVEKPDTVKAGKAKIIIAGNDVSIYKIVKPTGCISSVSKAAENLQSYIKTVTGTELPIIEDSNASSGYEICVGKTNRESGEIDRSTLKETHFTVKVEENRMFICGAVDASKRNGTGYAVYYLAEKELGFNFYRDDCTTCTPRANINFPDGYTYTDGPTFESRDFAMACIDSCYMHETYYSSSGWVHEQGAWINGSSLNDEMPCLSKEENVQKVITKVKNTFTKKPDRQAIWVSINDSWGYCKCADCMAAYREDGTRASTIIRLCNRVSEAIKTDFPGKKILTLAYQYTVKPVKVTKPADNILVYYCPIEGCPSHAYNDPDCNTNVNIAENIEGWGSILSEMYIWDYATNFKYVPQPLPNLYSLWDNFTYFAENGVTGIFINSVYDNCGEFSELRAYLYAQLTHHAGNMTEEEYFDKMNGFIRSYYGDNALYIRKYIDIIEEMTDDKHFGYESDPDAVFDYDEIIARMDEIDALWNGALEEAKGNTELLKRIRISEIQWLYLKQCATYDLYMVNGTAVQKAEYQKNNKNLYETIRAYGTGWRENEMASYSETTSPANW